jgi:hypothetical protein
MDLAEAVEEFVRSPRALKQSTNTLAAAYRRDLAAVGEVLSRRVGCSSATDLALDQVMGRLLRAALADFAEPGSVKRTALSQFPYSPALSTARRGRQLAHWTAQGSESS